jgi:hypothetical protein
MKNNHLSGSYALTNDYYHAAIVTTAIGLGSVNTVQVESNTLRNTRFGVNATLISNVKINSNTIHLQDHLNITDPVYGIYSGGSFVPQIYNNTIQRFGVAPNNADNKYNFVGIQLENSPNAFVHKNNLNVVGKGLQARGNNDQSKIQCNSFAQNFNGVFLDATVVGNQGIPSAPQDNKWISNGGQFKIDGNMPNLPSIWNYRNNGIYNINVSNLGATLISGNVVPPMIQNVNCINNPIGPFLPAPKSVVRSELFDPIVFDAKTFSVYDSTMRFIDLVYARTTFAYDTTWLTVGNANDADYLDFYQATDPTNLGMFCRIAKAYEEDDMVALESNNNALNTATCVFSRDLQIVNSIYAATWGAGIYTLTPLQHSVLEELACRDAIEYGPSVYAARVLLGEFISCTNGFTKTTQESSIYEPTILQNDVMLNLYPNPTQDIAYLYYDLGDRSNAVLHVYDLTGKLIFQLPMQSEQGTLLIDLSDLQSGVYLYQVVSDGERIGTGRMVRQ